MHQLADATLILGPPKTDAGRRTVVIPPHILDDLAVHFDRVGPDEADLVFTGEKGGPMRPHVLQKARVRGGAREEAAHMAGPATTPGPGG